MQSLSEHQLSRIIQVTEKYLNNEHLEGCLEGFLSELCQVNKLDYGFISFLNKDDATIAPLIAYNIPIGKIPTIKIGQNSITSHVIKSGELYVYPSKNEIDNNYVSYEGFPPKEEVVFPIYFSDSIIGVAVLASMERKFATPIFLNFHQLILNGVGSIVVYQRHISSSVELTKTFLRCDSISELCDKIAKTTSSLINNQVVRVWIIEEDNSGGKQLILKGWSGVELNEKHAHLYNLLEEDMGVTWLTIKEAKKTLKASNDKSVPLSRYYENIFDTTLGYKHVEFAKSNSLHSLICAPIFFGDEILGAINVYSKRKYNFSNIEISLMDGLAGYAGFEVLEVERVNMFRDIAQICNAGTLAVDYAHDIRHVMSYITGRVSRLLSLIPSNSLSKGDLQDVDEINRDLRYVDNLFITLNNLSKEKPPYFKQENLREIIESSFYLVGLKLKKINKIINCDNAIKVFCDKIKLTQVFMNLIHNAIHALGETTRPEKWIKVEVSIYPERQLDLKIKVTDNGTGVSPTNQERMFKQRFTTKSEYGSGFGLLLCQRNVQEIHKGRIEVHSKFGYYTSFHIYLSSSKEKFLTNA